MTKSIPRAWLIDVDSTITEPSAKKVPAQIFEKLEQVLLIPEPIALVSGRSISWLDERVTGLFENFVKNSKILDNLFISSEFGAMSKLYQNGKEHVSVNLPSTIPQDLINESQKITKKYQEFMFFDTSKKTMISVEMNDNLPLSKFIEPQKLIHAELEDLVKKYKLQEDFKVQSDTIATNIKHKNANKARAAREVLGWLTSRGLSPQKFTVIGDSLGDSEMAIELSSHRFPVEFVFVGESHDLEKLKHDFLLVLTKEHYWRGTLEYLTANT